MTTSPLVFMDTETTGLALTDDIWEFAAIRREPDGTETEFHCFIEHDRNKCNSLPEAFRTDHCDRYLDHRAYTRKDAAWLMTDVFRNGRPHVVGAVPNFDTERIARFTTTAIGKTPPWHYHLIDVENLAVGYLMGSLHNNPSSVALARGKEATVALPWDSNALSKQLGVDPEQFSRHTAMGDVRWAMAIYDAVMNGVES